MSWDDFRDRKPKEEEAKKPIYRHISTGHYYCILRVGRRMKNITNIRNFQRHMERQMNVPNADSSIKNEIIIGNSNVTDNVMDYLKNVKLRINNVLATEILLTGSPGFFQNMPRCELDKWIAINKRWLEKEFGPNVRYMTLHLDEST